VTRWFALCGLVLGAGCIDALAEVAEDIPGSGGGSTTTAGPGGTGGSTISVSSSSQGGSGLTPTSIAECQGHIYACGDLLDNDADELVDSVDPDCLGPCDNTEESYISGIPGGSGGQCKLDCYFDQDSGDGNDHCVWNHKCDPFESAPDFFPEPANGNQCAYNMNHSEPGAGDCATMMSTQPTECLEYCGPLTPNGCDCFGCCELPAGSRNYVWLGSEGADGNTVCTEAELGNPDICHPCTPVTACLNDCNVCELCVGKTQLPPECGDPSGIECPAGIEQCGLPGLPPCLSAFYCITGCCQPVPE